MEDNPYQVPKWRRGNIGNAIYEFYVWYNHDIDRKEQIGLILILPFLLICAGILLSVIGGGLQILIMNVIGMGFTLYEYIFIISIILFMIGAWMITRKR
jgi:hypothetical protein